MSLHIQYSGDDINSKENKDNKNPKQNKTKKVGTLSIKQNLTKIKMAVCCEEKTKTSFKE